LRGTKLWFSALILLVATTGPGLGAFEPHGIDGLEAWYAADRLGSETPGGLVTGWKDLTTNGHDLSIVEDALPATLAEDQVGGQPTVRIRKTTAFHVNDPFELGDHTIFLVLRTTTPERALFRSESDPFSGLVLSRGGEHDEYHDGGIRPGQVKRYASPGGRGGAIAVTILARRSGVLKSWLDGTDISLDTTFNGPIRVGVFFTLSHTTFAASDGQGLRIGEMLFYGRFLTDDERESVAGYLARKYGIETASRSPEGSPEAVDTPGLQTVVASSAAPVWQVAQLSTSSGENINQTGVAVEWDRQDELDPPFAHDADDKPTRLTWTGDATRVRLYVSLPLVSRVPDANIRVLFRVNGANFLSGEGRSGPFGVSGKEVRSSVRAEVIARLERGDYIEVVTVGIGESGEVVLEPGLAVFSAETR
jgi:hypothetical protein